MYQITLSDEFLMDAIATLTCNICPRKLSYISFEPASDGMLLIIKYKEMYTYKGVVNDGEDLVEWVEKRISMPIKRIG